MAQADHRTPGLGHAAGRWALAAWSLAFGLLASACLGGPHPVPPWQNRSQQQQTPTTLPNGSPPAVGAAGTGAGLASNGTDSAHAPVLSTAGAGAQTPPQPSGPAAAAGTGTTS